MSLLRGFSNVDKEGKIPIPNNIKRELKLKPGAMVEIRVSGPNNAPYIIVRPKKTLR